MLRPYVTDLPARRDLEFLTNSDKTWGFAWAHTDGTPVVIVSAVCTLEFDLPPTSFDPDTGEAEPDPDPVRHVIDAVDSGDPNGWIDTDRYPDGVALPTLPSGVWATLTGRSGNWDIQAVSDEGAVKVLARGLFTVSEGVT